MRPKILKDLFIGGKFVKATCGQTFNVINPMDASVIANVQRGSNEDIDLAVKAANEAF
jgi:acyl-CoA reductase-like NAD-dependent aldehyde dehydrogenase